MNPFKLRIWQGIGFGRMSVKYRDYKEVWIIFLFLRLRVSKKQAVNGY